MEMSFDDVLKHMKRRPRTLTRQNVELDRKTSDSKRYIAEDSTGKKFVIERYISIVTTEHIVVREHDPEANYSDAIDVFTEADEDDND